MGHPLRVAQPTVQQPRRQQRQGHVEGQRTSYQDLFQLKILFKLNIQAVFVHQEIKNIQGIVPEDPLYNTPTEYSYECVYENGVSLIISSKERGGITFEGTDGYVWVNRGGLETKDKNGKNIDLYELDEENFKVKLYCSEGHYRNFIDCIYTGRECIAPAEVAHRSITLSHLGNIGIALGIDKLKWDPDKEVFIGNDEANKMLKREYRKPWVLSI